MISARIVQLIYHSIHALLKLNVEVNIALNIPMI